LDSFSVVFDVKCFGELFVVICTSALIQSDSAQSSALPTRKSGQAPEQSAGAFVQAVESVVL